MTLLDFLTSLEQTNIGQAMRGEVGSEWLFPIVETLHVLSFSVVFGTIAMIDVRLLGVASRNSAVSKLSSDILPYTWVAFACAATTGSLMFVSKAHIYFYNWAFDFKFLCIILAGLNMLVINFGAYRRIDRWDLMLPPPRPVRLAGILSLAFWTGAIFFGRWIGFST